MICIEGIIHSFQLRKDVLLSLMGIKVNYVESMSYLFLCSIFPHKENARKNKICQRRLETAAWKEIIKSKAKQGQVFEKEDINQVKSCHECKINK